MRSQAPEVVELAESVLFWVLCARRALTVTELQHIYAMQHLTEDTELEGEDLPDSESLTGACGGLVSIDSERQTVHIVHYTAQQYFERFYAPQLLASRFSLTIACLSYVVLPNISRYLYN